MQFKETERQTDKKRKTEKLRYKATTIHLNKKITLNVKTIKVNVKVKETCFVFSYCLEFELKKNTPVS